MDEQDVLAPILSEQGLLILGGAVLGLIVITGICFTIILYRDPRAVGSFRGGRIVHYVTVFTVVFATIILALERVFTGEAAASILSGIVGYVLGTLRYQGPTDEQGGEAAASGR